MALHEWCLGRVREVWWFSQNLDIRLQRIKLSRFDQLQYMPHVPRCRYHDLEHMICSVAVSGGRDDEIFSLVHEYIPFNVDSILGSCDQLPSELLVYFGICILHMPEGGRHNLALSYLERRFDQIYWRSTHLSYAGVSTCLLS